MIKTKTKMVETEIVEDIICDFCGESCRKDTGDKKIAEFEYGTLHASWGYWSGQDGEETLLYVCEKCFARIIKMTEN